MRGPEGQDRQGDETRADQPRADQPRASRARVAALAAAAAALPLGVALVVLRQPRWYPAMDYALIELLVRDVGSSDPPLVGLVGRLYGWGERGSHPGPLAFYLLWPLYTLFGRTAWALEAATAALNLAAAAVAVWIGGRRGGRLGALGVAGLVAALLYTYRPVTFVQPWNPYLPLLWWVVFLLAAWSVLDRDLALLPVAAFAGSLCAQTHLSYAGLVGGVAAVVAAVLARGAVRSGPDERRRLTRWALAALGTALALWLPPIVQELTERPGNLAILWSSYTDPDSPPVGLGWTAVKTWLAYLDVRALAQARDIHALGAEAGSPLPGLALLAAWGWSVVRARRDGHVRLLRLHLVVGAALTLGLASITRIQGGLAHWVVLWAWGTTALVVAAVAAVAVAAWPAPRPSRLRAATVLATALLVVGAGRVTVLAAGTEPDVPDASPLLADLAPDAVAGLRDGRVPGTGEDGRYLLRWASRGGFADAAPYGLLLELERQGLDVGTPEIRGRSQVPYRWRDPEDATAFVDYVVGAGDIARQRRRPGAVEIARAGGQGGRHPPVAVFVTPARP